jgi:putative endonuclease
MSSIPLLSSHLETGKIGERLAAEHLEKLGWNIVQRNWKAGRGEIDLIAWADKNLLVFVEVKTRTNDSFGGPEGAVKRQKLKILARTAGFYMETIGYEWEFRFDVVAIILKNGALHELRHIEDAFFPKT